MADMVAHPLGSNELQFKYLAAFLLHVSKMVAFSELVLYLLHLLVFIHDHKPNWQLERTGILRYELDHLPSKGGYTFEIHF